MSLDISEDGPVCRRSTTIAVVNSYSYEYEHEGDFVSQIRDWVHALGLPSLCEVAPSCWSVPTPHTNKAPHRFIKPEVLV